jgi:hypothetical protein
MEKKPAVKVKLPTFTQWRPEKNIEQFKLCKPQNIFLCNCTVSQTLGILTGNNKLAPNISKILKGSFTETTYDFLAMQMILNSYM